MYPRPEIADIRGPQAPTTIAWELTPYRAMAGSLRSLTCPWLSLRWFPRIGTSR
jgi:hypothetical protein